ncbi:hypothetical protein IG631_21842 [Alternaria alternata]|nr:hypothetical protein IG631_21842 [Alternaria alternata]
MPKASTSGAISEKNPYYPQQMSVLICRSVAHRKADARTQHGAPPQGTEIPEYYPRSENRVIFSRPY